MAAPHSLAVALKASTLHNDPTKDSYAYFYRTTAVSTVESNQLRHEVFRSEAFNDTLREWDHSLPEMMTQRYYDVDWNHHRESIRQLRGAPDLTSGRLQSIGDREFSSPRRCGPVTFRELVDEYLTESQANPGAFSDGFDTYRFNSWDDMISQFQQVARTAAGTDAAQALPSPSLAAERPPDTHFPIANGSRRSSAGSTSDIDTGSSYSLPADTARRFSNVSATSTGTSIADLHAAVIDCCQAAARAMKRGQPLHQRHFFYYGSDFPQAEVQTTRVRPEEVVGYAVANAAGDVQHITRIPRPPEPRGSAQKRQPTILCQNRYGSD